MNNIHDCIFVILKYINFKHYIIEDLLLEAENLIVRKRMNITKMKVKNGGKNNFNMKARKKKNV